MRDPQGRFNTMLQKLRETGHRFTPQRLAILKIIAESRNHPSAEAIFEQMKVNFPTSSMATVYKILSVLKELGEVLELEFSSDYNRYDGNRPFPHPHLICIRCKRIIDPDLNGFAEMTQKLTSETGYKIISLRMEVFMEIPTYVTVEEVQRVCTLLNLRDWTTQGDSAVLLEEARVILPEVNTEGMNIDVESFRKGLEVELEHGIRFKDANVTNNHPLLTGKIVLAHLKETLDYYERLEVAELEGDLLKAAVAKNSARVESLYRKLLAAKLDLARVESEKLNS